MAKDLTFYIERFSRLRVDRSRGVAPHKPILLLCVIELAQQGLLVQNRVFLSPELIAAFLKYWSHLGSDSHRSDIALPFWHLSKDGFWHLKAKPGFEAIVSSNIRPRTIAAIREMVSYAYLDNELFQLLQDSSSRLILTKAVVASWFSDKVGRIDRLLFINSLQDLEEQLREQGGAIYRPEDLIDEAETILRDAAFRNIITSIYEYRCAFCGLRVIGPSGKNIVDGAHIKPFSKFYDDRIDNGLSLCKNHHWAFDRGWFGIDETYRIVVSTTLLEESPSAKRILEFQGEPIILPAQLKYNPRVEALRWHLENIFSKGEDALLDYS